jgi:hypothetical protein
VQQLFSPIREAVLNADEIAALNEARAAGENNFVVSNDWILARTGKESGAPVSEADALVEAFLGDGSKPALRQLITEYIGKPADDAHRTQRLRLAAIALLQTPDYQLC